MMNVKNFIVVRNMIVSVIALLLHGCVVPFLGGFGANHQSLDDFKIHVEAIFRLQNQMSSEVIMLIDSDEGNKHEALKQAEHTMQHVCADLNEYASRDMDGLDISLVLQRRVEKSAIDCEKAALAIKPLLPQ